VSAIGAAFADEPAFVPYLAAGDPDADASVEYVRALERGGADVIELGLPFSEPIAEGPTIQDAVVRSLDGGMTPAAFFETVSRLDVDVPLVCMTYYNLIYQFGRRTSGDPGPEVFVERAAEVGIDGFVVPDLPAEEAGPLRTACDEHDLDLIFIVAPTTRGERLERIMARVSGYVYVQARLGVTGARADVSTRTTASLDRLADWDVPKAVGFGITTGDHAREVVAAGADGVIVGSALVDLIAEGNEAGDPVETVADRLEAKARELKQGALDGATSKTGVEADGGAGPETGAERETGTEPGTETEVGGRTQAGTGTDAGTRPERK
jgi:tryptophan synthase alpha chain